MTLSICSLSPLIEVQLFSCLSFVEVVQIIPHIVSVFPCFFKAAFVTLFFAERRKEEDYDEEVEEDLQDEVQLLLDCFFYFVWSSVIFKKANGYLSFS